MAMFMFNVCVYTSKSSRDEIIPLLQAKFFLIYANAVILYKSAYIIYHMDMTMLYNQVYSYERLLIRIYMRHVKFNVNKCCVSASAII